MKGVYIFLADGFEETEALATLDVLRRGGVDVKTVSMNDSKHIVSSHNLTVHGDIQFADLVLGGGNASSCGCGSSDCVCITDQSTELCGACEDDTVQEEEVNSSDVMIFPGGMPGTKNLESNKTLMALMFDHYSHGGTVAAICAAPGLIVSKLPDLKGKKVTCYDGFESKLIEQGAEYVKLPAVTDGRIITGRGAGCAVDFGLEVLKYLRGEEVSEGVAKGIMLR